MTLVVGGVQRDVHPWQAIQLPFGNDCVYTVFVSSVIYLVCHGGRLTNKRRQTLCTSVQISESMRFRTHVYWIFFSLFWWVPPPVKIFDTFLRPCIGNNDIKCIFKASRDLHVRIQVARFIVQQTPGMLQRVRKNFMSL